MKPSLQLRSIHLRVRDLERSVEFYAGKLGFVVVHRTTGQARLAASPGEPALLTLTGDPRASQAAPDAAGLFHAALLFPGRPALARWLRHVTDAGVRLDGFSDHGVSEAVYLSDPDGNGLEFYSDRPQDAWPRQNGGLAMMTAPLDVDGLLRAGASPVLTVLEGARWGHLHLRVTELDRSEKFYADTLGVALTQRYGTSARFLAADDYHHHLGLNTWGVPRRPQPADALGLIEAVFARTGISGERTVRDPDGIASSIVSLKGSP